MIKIDFHIHTMQVAPWDSDFTFSMDKLDSYVKENNLNCIAITNHNKFFRRQFEDISNHLNSITVLPGIEIHVLNGHVLVIGDVTSIGDIDELSNSLTGKIHDLNDNLSLAEFSALVKDKHYLIIPHYYGKTRALSYTNIKKIDADIFVGEAGNHKRFNTMLHNKDERLTPVLFSDIRCFERETETEEDAGEETRYTYLNIEGITFDRIYNGLKEKKNVSLSPFKDDTFDLLNGNVRGHCGINVLLGKRSTGKSYLLNNIYNSFKNEGNVLYIHQFEIAQYSTKEQFKKMTDSSNKLEIKKYCQDLNDLLLAIHEKDFTNERYDVNMFLSTLSDYADANTMSNAFSKMPLFNYDAIQKQNGIKDMEIADAIAVLLDADDERKSIIEDSIQYDNLRRLYYVFLGRAKEAEYRNRIIDEANIIAKTISDALAQNSPIEPIKHVNFNDIFEYAYTKQKFNTLLGDMHTIDIIDNIVSEKFHRKVSISKPSYSNQNKYKKETGFDRIDALKNKDFFRVFIDNSANMIQQATEDELYKYFVAGTSSITTNGKKDLSGGEKAEYILIEKLQYSSKKDIVLIDEMESSFDNLYLNSFINGLLHDIARESTVFISTHNNNLGVSLKPDYYIYHLYDDSKGEEVYKRFYGSQMSDELRTIDGETLKLSSILVETMEASPEAYDERKMKYEIFENK